MADPVSWLVIEPGWRVVATDGPQLGWVDKVLGDESLDIFHGLSVAGGRLEIPRYVKSEQVGGIVNGLVTLTVDAHGFDHLPEYHAPEPTPIATESLLDQPSSFSAAPPVPQKGRFPILERITRWFRGTGTR